MRRVLALVLALMVVTGVALEAAADAKKKKRKPRRERTVEMIYTEPAVGAAGVGVCLQGSSCAFTQPLKGERYARVEITDDLGLPVFASIIQDTDGDGNYLPPDATVHICGETVEPIEIDPSLTVTVWVWRGPGADPPCPGPASSGTIAVIFSNRP